MHRRPLCSVLALPPSIYVVCESAMSSSTRNVVQQQWRRRMALAVLGQIADVFFQLPVHDGGDPVTTRRGVVSPSRTSDTTNRQFFLSDYAACRYSVVRSLTAQPKRLNAAPYFVHVEPILGHRCAQATGHEEWHPSWHSVCGSLTGDTARTSATSWTVSRRDIW